MSGQDSSNLPSHLWRALLFLRNFFKHPAMLGSVIPSSPFLVNDVLNKVDWEAARVIVEYGPGVGTLTREVLNRMHPDCRLIAIELNSEFVQFLQEKIQDPRFDVVHGSACDARSVLEQLGVTHADYIISGIPYSTMTDSTRRQITRHTKEMLKPDGALLMFQFTTTVLPYLESSFRSVKKDFQLLNIPPARIFHCTP